MWAAWSKYPNKVLDKLLSHGADIHARDNTVSLLSACIELKQICVRLTDAVV